RRSYRPILVVPRSGPLTDWASNHGVPSFSLPENTNMSRLGFLRQVLALSVMIRRERVALLHAIAPLCYRAAGLAGALTGVKRVCHIEFAPTPGELDWCLRYGVDAIITCYRDQARETLELMAPRKPVVVAIPNSVDAVRFTPVAPDGEGDRQRWRQGGEHVIVIVGHLSEVKGYPTFLQAAASLSRKLPGCRFLALGGETTSPGYGAKLKEMAVALGIADRVDFLGWQKNVPQI